MSGSEAQRLKSLQDEIAKLKNLLAEAMPDMAILKEIAAKNGSARCEAGGCAQVVAVHGVGQRRACEVLAVDRSGVLYRSIRPDNAAVWAAMKAGAAERRRFGYWRIHIMLERQGIVIVLKKLRRPYREEKMQGRKCGGRKKALGPRRPMVLPRAVNQRWSLDFISAAATVGRRFRFLAVVDDFMRECLLLIAETSLSGSRVARELDAIIDRRGRPNPMGCDNGKESTSTAICLGAKARPSIGITSPLGKPMQSEFIQSYYGRFGAEFLNEVLFSPLNDARSQIAAWKEDYSRYRPHSAAGNIPPAEFSQNTRLQKLSA